MNGIAGSRVYYSGAKIIVLISFLYSKLLMFVFIGIMHTKIFSLALMKFPAQQKKKARGSIVLAYIYTCIIHPCNFSQTVSRDAAKNTRTATASPVVSSSLYYTHSRKTYRGIKDLVDGTFFYGGGCTPTGYRISNEPRIPIHTF